MKLTIVNSEARVKCLEALTLLAETNENTDSLLETGVVELIFILFDQEGPDPSLWEDSTASW